MLYRANYWSNKHVGLNKLFIGVAAATLMLGVILGGVVHRADATGFI